MANQEQEIKLLIDDVLQRKLKFQIIENNPYKAIADIARYVQEINPRLRIPFDYYKNEVSYMGSGSYLQIIVYLEDYTVATFNIAFHLSIDGKFPPNSRASYSQEEVKQAIIAGLKKLKDRTTGNLRSSVR